MYTNARFQSMGTSSDFGTKFVQKNTNERNFEKTNVKIVTTT